VRRTWEGGGGDPVVWDGYGGEGPRGGGFVEAAAAEQGKEGASGAAGHGRTGGGGGGG
jgi:hypothetical protein